MTTLTKGQIGVQDQKQYDGQNKTFTRDTSTGGSQTLLKPTSGTGAVDILAAYGSGTEYTLATLNSALSAIGSNSAAILFTPGTWTITDDVTIPANVGIIPVVGAVLTVSAGKTLTINGDLWPYDAGYFAGSGTVDTSSATAITVPSLTVSNGVTADITGNVTGNVTGNLTGDVTGDVTGNLTGNVTGDITGDTTGNVSGYSNTADTTNVAGGYNALATLSTGTNNTAFGYEALTSINNESGNTAIGWNSLKLWDAAGNPNTAVGYGSLDALLSGNGGNTGIGYNALGALGNGNSNTALGHNAGAALSAQSQNTAIGYQALDAATANLNVAVGADAFGSVTTGGSNTAIGTSSGTTLTTGSNVTVVGYDAEPSANNATNEITLGDANITSLRCNDQTIDALSDERDKSNIKALVAGLDFINDMKPVTYDWTRRDGSMKGLKGFGFIAQEALETEKKYNMTQNMGMVKTNNPEKLEMSYGKLVPVLVKAVQELSAKVKELEGKQ
jgi:hypothetical protein